ncbi:hypothetical protein FA15DRAFT_138493 [Coprinopsis marcescibilis]|uniref:Uncharacterized protein n=1 Tax=Coprinopsis marcescibilis TaxID=230819 RepID=A0A5C3KIX1_COPMA|nr:hypothetical protein FA15DRAFT_138493 [Coprinopsis marcescibilis]
MQTPPQIPKPILKRLFSRINTTFRRQNLAHPQAIESESGPNGVVSFGRKMLQTATVVTSIGASVAEAVPGGTIAKGVLESLSKHNLQNKEDATELRREIGKLVLDLSASEIPAGDAAFDARQHELVGKLCAKAKYLVELLEDPSAKIRSQAISQLIAACFRDVERFKMDYLSSASNDGNEKYAGRSAEVGH